MAERLVTEPIRSLGTRVCIFCSRILTRARISETICTPLLFAAVEGTPPAVLAVLAAREGRRLPMGRGTGVRRRVDGLAVRPGCVAERAREEAPLEGVETPLRGGGKPARWSTEGGVIGLVSLVGRGEAIVAGVGGNSFAGISGGGVRSARESSEGVGTERRSSSDSDSVAW